MLVYYPVNIAGITGSAIQPMSGQEFIPKPAKIPGPTSSLFVSLVTTSMTSPDGPEGRTMEGQR
jgi:hypothetical protein